MSVEKAAAKYAAARRELEREIRREVAEGKSLRDVARRSGWSHEQVRTVVKRGERG